MKIGCFILWLFLLFVTGVFAADNSGRYEVTIQGVNDAALKRSISESSMCYKLIGQPSPMTGQLRVRMQKDLSTLETLLKSKGYYNAQVSAELVQSDQKRTVVFSVNLGAAFLFRTIELTFSGSEDPRIQSLKSPLLEKSKMTSQRVLNEQKRMLAELTYRGYPFPELKKRTIQVDLDQHVVDLLLEFDQGEWAEFGDTKLEGLTSLDPDYVLRQIPWSIADVYDKRLIEALEKKLLESGLFTAVTIQTLEPEAPNRAVPISMYLSERTPRTLQLGGTYSDIGPGGSIDWEHRNAFGGGEHVETSLFWDSTQYGADASLLLPGYLAPDQSLLFTLETADDSPDAYDAQSVKGLAMLYKDFSPQIKGGLGFGYKLDEVEQLSDTESYSHALIPLELSFDGRDDLLNPVNGFQSFIHATYYEDTQDSDSFLKALVEGRYYRFWWDRYRLSSALRLCAGTIQGTSISSVPADERFYAGGGGSIRGYEYQEVGPEVDGTRVGGNQLLEFSAELRLRPGNSLGYVAFIDGGTVYNDVVESVPSMRYGAGLGVRWFTPIGPIRVDTAYPLNADSSQAERPQFYISLGQAF